MWVEVLGQQVPFGSKLLFCHPQNAALCLAVELCEDLWAPVSPSAAHALAGATLVLNLSASDELVGKAEYRRSLVSSQSARLLCGYLYADAGSGDRYRFHDVRSNRVFPVHRQYASRWYGMIQEHNLIQKAEY